MPGLIVAHEGLKKVIDALHRAKILLIKQTKLNRKKSWL